MIPPAGRDAPLTADPNYAGLKAHVIGRTGLAYYQDRDAELSARVARRMAMSAADDCSAYLNLLRRDGAGGAELDALVTELTIGETHFFRHIEQFDAIRDCVIPDLLARNAAARRLRIWSAGCAIGAEPYTLAILLGRHFTDRLAGWDVSITGTDINREFLARAREGRYDEWALRSLPEEIRQTCFRREGTGWRLAEEYRRGVSFQYHNLVENSYPSRVNGLAEFDLILCRNVTIYFHPELTRATVERLRQCLVPGGWLAVGYSELNIEHFRAFRAVSFPGAVVYQNSSEPDRPLPPAAIPPARPSGDPAPSGSDARTAAAAEPAWLHWRPPDLAGLTVPESASPAGAEAGGGAAAGSRPAGIRDLMDRGDWPAAVRLCEEWMARDRLNPEPYFHRAMAAEHAGEHSESETWLRKAIYLDRTYVLAHYFLGSVLQRCGRTEPAARAFRNVLSLLAGIDAAAAFPEADGITAGELRKLAAMQLETLSAP